MTERLPLNLNIKLSLMMFLQYAIWGAWLPILWPYMEHHVKLTGPEIGWVFSVGAVGAIVGPFIAGQLCDRLFSTQVVLGVCHLAGAGVIYALSQADAYMPIMWLSLLYGLVYAPTLSLTNSLAFHHLPDRDRDFGRVRVWGTIGWVAAGIFVGRWLARHYTSETLDAGRADAFLVSAVLGVVMGVYCFLLPHTPPARSEAGSNAAWKAIGEIKYQPLLTLFLLAVPVSCIHQFYFVHTSQFLTQVQESTGGGSKFNEMVTSIFGVGGGGLMTIGQMAEILVLAALPLVAKRVSRKALLAIGLVAYAARMAAFVYMADSMPAIMSALALHGLCFGCFIFVAFMVVDEETTPDVRASAQSLFNLIIVGIGIIVGSQIAGWAHTASALEGGGTDWSKLFAYPMWASLACLAVLLLLYPNRSPRRGVEGGD